MLGVSSQDTEQPINHLFVSCAGVTRRGGAMGFTSWATGCMPVGIRW